MPRFLALDADAAGLTLAAATVTGAAVAVEHALPVTLAGEPAPLTLANAAAYGARLKETLRDAKIRPAPLLVSIGRERVVFKEVKYPATEPADEPAMVRMQAQRDLAESPDDLLMDYRPLDPAADGLRRAQVGFVRKDVVQAVRALAEAAGLKLAGVTPRPFALAAAYRGARPDAGVVALVSGTAQAGGEFTVVRGGDVRFTRTLPTSAFADEAALAAELKRNLVVYRGQAGSDAVTSVAVAEAEDAPGAWAGRLDGRLPVPVRGFDPLAEAPVSVPATQRGRFAAAVGLLAGQAAGAPMNFVSARQPRADTGRKNARLVLGALVGAVALAALAAAGFLVLDRADTQLTQLQSERAQLDQDLQRLTADAARLDALDAFERREIVWLDLVYDVSDRVTNVVKASVTEIDGIALAAPKTANRPGAAAGVNTYSATLAAFTATGPKPAPGAAPRPAGPAKPLPVAALRINLRTAERALPQEFADSFRNDPYFTALVQTEGGQSEAKGGKLYVYTMQAANRPPGLYTRRLTVAPPAPPPADDDFTSLEGAP